MANTLRPGYPVIQDSIDGVARRRNGRRWDINKRTRTLGYWNAKCPVKTNAPDVFASVYLNEGKALVCLASWARETRSVTLAVDWEALGMTPDKVAISLPDVGSVRKPQATIT